MVSGKRASAGEPALAGGTSLRYIETSALLAAGLEHDAGAQRAVRGEGERFVSVLTLAEARRALVVRAGRGQLSTDDYRTALRWLRRFERRCRIVEISPWILARVGRAFPVEPVRTLDAIHLATVESLEDDPSEVAVVTRDHRIAENARAMGYLVE